LNRGPSLVDRNSYLNKYEGRNPKQIQNLNDQTLKLATEVTENSENSIIFNRRERKGRRVYKYMHIYLWSTLCFETKIA